MTPEIANLAFVICCLATYRLSLLISKERGPFRIFARLRKTPPNKSEVKEWLSCIFCFSMTAAAVVCACAWLAGLRLHPAEWFVVLCALSAASIIANQLFTKGPL